MPKFSSMAHCVTIHRCNTRRIARLPSSVRKVDGEIEETLTPRIVPEPDPYSFCSSNSHKTTTVGDIYDHQMSARNIHRNPRPQITEGTEQVTLLPPYVIIP